MKILKNKFKGFFSSLFIYKEPEKYNFSLSKTVDETSIENNNPINNSDTLQPLEDLNQTVYPSIAVNLEYIQVKYNSIINSDIKIREFAVTARNKQYKAFLLYIDGMVNTDAMNKFILDPLMLRNRANTFDNSQDVVSTGMSNKVTVKKVKKFDLVEYINNSLIPQNDVKQYTEFKEIIAKINSGDCALFVDTINCTFVMDVKGFKQRSVAPPNNELVIRGPQEAFVEAIRTNTSLLRRMVNNENLIIENLSIGTVSNTTCAVCYIKDIANNDLVSEVKYRLNNLNIDYLVSSGQLQQLVEDNGKYSLPQIIASERPDRCTNFLLEGRVVVLVNGSPYALIMPATFLDFLASVEDVNLKYQFTNLLKVIRLFSLIITLLLPGLYMAVTSFHQELIPTELLFAIVSSREAVPFPIIFEIIVMEISFELIREAGLRVPSPIGPTIGIVGGLILGEAAVSANIVSPILIIVVAITGISSFSIPDFYLSFHLRLARFAYIFLGYFAGFLGVGLGLFIHFSILSSINSYGVPYLSPYVPITKRNDSGFFRSPIWKHEKRPAALNTKRSKMQEDVSMEWKRGN